MPSRFSLPHIDIAPFSGSSDYAGSGNPFDSEARVRTEHGRRIQNELRTALRVADQNRPTDPRLEPATGTFLEVELRSGEKADVLEAKKAGIRPGAVKDDANNDRTIALYVPDHARLVLEKVLEDYLNGPLRPETQNPPQKDKVEAIEAIRVARLETFWTDQSPVPTDRQQAIWWALWCWAGSEAAVEGVCQRLEIRTAGEDRRLSFPEITVIPALASRAAIELLLFATGGIAKLRRANDTPVFFTDDVRGEQHPWVDDLAGRITWPSATAPAVCIFDTGVNRAHALIEPAAAPNDLHALDPAWGVDDHDPDGHGTSMAGTALHGDLTAALLDTAHRVLTHRVESVKFLPPTAFDPNQPHTYGVLTQAAVARPEITAPDRDRVFCMAVSNENISGAAPSSWSAAIDQAASGTMPGDTADSPKRLFIIAGGNIPPEIDYARIQPHDNFPIEDPAQAWNAITVGGYTDLTNVRDRGYERWSPFAAAGELSPHSRTSVTWPQGRSPFKPEIVMEAGNRAINPARTEVLTVNSLSLLSTAKDIGAAPLVSFEATSAAAAQAARLATQLAAEHPEYWPETIRALIIHSAEWTEPMLGAFAASPNKRSSYELVRRFGYGVPSFERAAASAQNHLALFAQSEIQPFRVAGGRKFNECHYFSLPIPGPMLEQLENKPVQLKVTLSYFIEPNPGLSANVDPQRYQSFGLRFDLRRKNETVDQFKLRVNAFGREDVRRAPEPDDNRWVLGPQSVSAGSLHCDVWTGPAIELLRRDTICIKPINGWWRQRAKKEICERRTRYALIVSLKCDDENVDLYTPIQTLIDQKVSISTPV